MSLLFVVYTLVANVPARPLELPRYDVALHCSSGVASVAFNECSRAEEAAREAVRTNWAAYPEQRKHFCLQTEKFRQRADRSYLNLSQCLQDLGIS